MMFKKLVEKINLIGWWFRYRQFDKEIWEENKSLSKENQELWDENCEQFRRICELEDKNFEQFEDIHERDREIDKLNYYINEKEEETRKYEEAFREIARLTIGFDATSHLECVDVIHKIRLQLLDWVCDDFEDC